MKKSKVTPKTNVSAAVETVCEAQKCRCNPILYFFIFIISLFSVFLFVKIDNIEKKLAKSPNVLGQQAEASVLEVDNLKKIAKEVGLNTGTFNKCLDSNQKKAAVDADVAYGSSIGVQGTPGFFVNGRFFAGAFPFELFKEVIDKEIAGTGSDNCSDYSENLSKYCADAQNKPFDPVAKTIEVGNSPYEGAANPKVTIVEFSDFQCPFCVRAYPTVSQILKTYKNDVRIYFKQLPLVNLHPYALKAAEASLCVLDQGNDKFWKFHNKLFELQQSGT